MARKLQSLAVTLLASGAMVSGTLAVPASAHQAVVRAHIAIGCHPASHRHHRRLNRHSSSRCQAARLGHLLLAHAA